MIRQRIAVIGGVAAGPAAAAHAKRIDPDADVVLFERGSNISYGACELPYYVADQIESAETLVVFRPEAFERDKRVSVRTGHEVTDIRPDRNRLVVREVLSGRSFEERFDKFILATGAVAIRPELDGSEAANLFVVRSLDDGVDLKNYLATHRVRHAVVLGGGYVGLEMAEAMVTREIRATVLEPAAHVLHRYVSADSGRLVETLLQEHGVAVRRERAVGFNVSGSGLITSVATDQGESIGCQLVIAAVGTRPDSTLAARAGLRIRESGAVDVDSRMRTSAPNVWACGDCIEVTRVIDGTSVYSPLAQTAFRTARVAAENAARRGRGAVAQFPGTCEASAVKVFGLEVARVGLTLEWAKKAGFDAFDVAVDGWSRVSFYPGAQRLRVELTVERRSGRLLGGTVIGREGAAMRANVLVPLVWRGAGVREIRDFDLVYAPPVAPSIDPILVAANRAAEGLKSSH